jgi:2-polyprenyl-6-methoxyphenol hydroxylase-like FAD-dependent oxidoreductase
MSERFEVAIAGGGIAGLGAALAFRRSGAKVTLLEQASAFAPVGAGILLQANGLMVLDALGLGAEVRAQGTAMPRFLLRDSQGRGLTSTEVSSHLPPRFWPVCIHRAQLHDILWQACVRARVTTHFGYKVKTIERRRAASALICETADGTVSVSGNLIIGADGVRSAVREAAGIATHLWPVVEGSVQGTVPYSVQADCHGEYLSGSEACGMLPMGRDATFWFWGEASRTAVGAAGREFAGWRDDVCRRFPPMRRILSQYSTWDDMVRLQHRSVRCDTWSSGNVVLIGDAAHAMSPNLGQGANCALVDALALASHIATGHPNADVSVALARFERDRRPQIDSLQQQGHDESTSVLRRWPGSEIIVNLALRLTRLASSSRQRADVLAMSGLDGTGLDLAAAGVRTPISW